VDRFWFLTWHTYGTWLPGDARGFVTELRDANWNKYLPNVPGSECQADLPGLKRFASDALAGEPVWLSAEHATTLLSQFRETAQYRKWELFAVAVLVNHAHLVVGVRGDPEPATILGDFKEYGSRALNRQFGKPPARWWTQTGSKRKLPHADALRGAIAYTRDQDRPLLVWLNESAIRATFPATEAASLISPEREDQQGERHA
jgi:hypothetical protein